MSGNVSKIDAQTQTTSIKHQNMFDDILRINGYPEDSIDQTKHPQSHQRNSPPPNVDWPYLKLPYISERSSQPQDHLHFPKRGHTSTSVAHRSYTLRRALSRNGTQAERICTRDNCPTSKTKLCLLRNAVYQITCNNCNQHYIGSTTRFIHDRVKEHLNSENSSVCKETHLHMPKQRLQRY